MKTYTCCTLLRLSEKQYAKNYEKGWKASGADRIGDLTDAESRFCSRNGFNLWGSEHHAWLDGWMDFASSREKWHLRYCNNHGHAEGECGAG